MKKYEYLIYSCFLLLCLLLVLLKRKDLKPHIIIPCLAGGAIGPISELLYFKDYWHPYTVFGQSIPGIEDVIFGSSMIGLSLVIYPLLFKRQEWQAHHKKHLKLSIIYLLIGVVILVTLVKFGINSIFATAITCVVLSSPLYIIRHDLIKPSLISGVVITIFVGLIYYIAIGYIFRGALTDVWLLSHTALGILVFKYIPLSELIWFFTVGSFLEAFDQYVSGESYRRFRQRSRLVKKSN